jgi:hypothetical protein
MSECGGAHTLSNPTDENVAGVGKTLEGVSSKIDKPDKDGNGEVNTKFLFYTTIYMCIIYNFLNQY